MERQASVPTPTTVTAPPQPSVLDTPKIEVVKKLPTDNNAKMKLILVGIVVVIAGLGTGYGLSGASAKSTNSPATAQVAEKTVDSEGRVDESVLSGPEQGVLREGGIDGEGTHYLDRGLGAEKYIYLLSTVLDLNSFVDKKVEVQGQTLGADKAGWLMDVVRVKVIE